MIEQCPAGYGSLFSLIPTLSLIGNVSKSTGIIMLNGENDSLTPEKDLSLLALIKEGESDPLEFKPKLILYYSV
jgi:hypothetical protein